LPVGALVLQEPDRVIPVPRVVYPRSLLERLLEGQLSVPVLADDPVPGEDPVLHALLEL
jgi:hypothetical protein